MPNKLRLLIVAGEPSGDAHAAALVHALQQTSSDVQFEFFGATGPQLRAAGVETVVPTDELSIFGLIEIGNALPKFLGAYRELKRAAIARNADAAILVDWPDFNLRLAHALHRRGVKVIYYISPQLWAWRSHRVRSIKRDVDLLLAILPFEKDWYAARGVDHVEFVGHPLAGEVKPSFDRREFCRRHALDPAKPIISLLPGSRRKELIRILPAMLAAAAIAEQKGSDAQFVLVIAPSRTIDEARQIIDAIDPSQQPKNLVIVHHETREALAASDAAAVASGTATLEAALLNTPMVVVYKESVVNWHTLGRMISAEHYGLVNLIAGRRVMTELIQNQLNGEQLASELLALLEPERNATMRAELRLVKEKLGDGGASVRAARAVVKFLAG